MSNVKRVDMMGWITFNTNEFPKLNEYLGQLNQPSLGLRITYPGGTRLGPKNEHGGNCTFYRFSIDGEEAVAVEWLENIMREIVHSGGEIDHARVRDIENGINLRVNIPKPDTRPLFGKGEPV